MTTSHAHPHDHDHDHSGDHGPHGHDQPSADATHGRGRKLLAAFVLTALMMAVEVAGGLMSSSLALLADAGHMMVDALALLLAFISARLATRPADERRSYGYGRLEVLAGFVNALAQFVLVAFIAYEAITRFFHPVEILSGVMLYIAIAGLLVNGLVLRTLHGHDHDDMNAAGASLHVLGDLLGSVAAVVAAAAIRWLGWNWADPLLSLLVSLLILSSAWRLLRRSGHILLEGVPDGMVPAEVEAALRVADPSIRNVHHLHVWQLASGSRMATVHAALRNPADGERALLAMRTLLLERYGVRHVTVQIDPGPCLDDIQSCGGHSTH